jgi:hypothetical protein
VPGVTNKELRGFRLAALALSAMTGRRRNPIEIARAEESSMCHGSIECFASRSVPHFPFHDMCIFLRKTAAVSPPVLPDQRRNTLRAKPD